MEKKKTLVIGASDNPERYSNMAVKLLTKIGHPVVAVGNKQASIDGLPIIKTIPTNEKFHTVTLYINPSLQQAYYKQIIDLQPERVIFNPGTENEDFAQELMVAGIDPLEACTLVLLNTHQY